VRNSKKQVPINAWKREHTDLSLEMRELDRDYKQLKNEVDATNKIRVNVYDILRKKRQGGEPTKSHDMTL